MPVFPVSLLEVLHRPKRCGVASAHFPPLSTRMVPINSGDLPPLVTRQPPTVRRILVLSSLLASTTAGRYQECLRRNVQSCPLWETKTSRSRGGARFGCDVAAVDPTTDWPARRRTSVPKVFENQVADADRHGAYR